MSIQVGRGGLVSGAEFIPLVSAAVHYWRHDRSQWDEVLSHVASMGFRLIETYAPWSVHERLRGHFDFNR